MNLPELDQSWTLFLDRDGVLNRKVENGYVLDCSMLELLPGTQEAVGVLGRLFGNIVIVTNQRGVARGLMSHPDLDAVHRCLIKELGPASRYIRSILACTHDIEDRCDCRKPKPGLALRAQALFPEIDFGRSVMLGDSDSDIEMGRQLGMYTVLVTGGPKPTTTVSQTLNLLEFARACDRRSNTRART